MSWKTQLSRSAQEIRFLCCPKSPSSKGPRDFFFKNYSFIKELNPRFPFLIRENPLQRAYVVVRYDYNETKVFDVTQFSESEMEEVLEAAVELGSDMPRSAESDPYELELMVE